MLWAREARLCADAALLEAAVEAPFAVCWASEMAEDMIMLLGDTSRGRMMPDSTMFCFSSFTCTVLRPSM